MFKCQTLANKHADITFDCQDIELYGSGVDGASSEMPLLSSRSLPLGTKDKLYFYNYIMFHRHDILPIKEEGMIPGWLDGG